MTTDQEALIQQFLDDAEGRELVEKIIKRKEGSGHVRTT